MQSNTLTIQERDSSPESLAAEVIQMDEVTFWSRQLAEHSLFIAKALQAGFQELQSMGQEDLISMGIELNQVWMDIFRRLLARIQVTTEELLENIFVLRNYLNQVGALTLSTWAGFNYPSLVEHYLEELAHTERHVRGEQIPEEQLIAFWTDIHKDHAALFARLLDPTEKENFEQSLLYEQLFESAALTLNPQNIDDPELDLYVALSQHFNDFNTFTATLREQQAIGQLRSVIHPLLALHIHREGLRSIAVLQL